MHTVLAYQLSYWCQNRTPVTAAELGMEHYQIWSWRCGPKRPSSSDRCRNGDDFSVYVMQFVLCTLNWCKQQLFWPNAASFSCWNITHITPHLNIHKYPRRCVRSLPEQSHKSSTPLRSCHFLVLCHLCFSLNGLVASFPRSPSEWASPHSSCGAI